MSVDELWTLHETISTLLVARIESEKRQLEDRLQKLSRPLCRDRASVDDRIQRFYPNFKTPCSLHKPGQVVEKNRAGSVR